MLVLERPQQLDDLLGVPPQLTRPGAVSEPVQFLADLHVRLALPPQFEGHRPNRVIIKVLGELRQSRPARGIRHAPREQVQ